MATSPYTIHTLKNGLLIAIEKMPDVRSAAAGFLARTGARDETPDLAGVSHFLEHMCFKGTGKRDWREVAITFDRLGSTYNAFTSEDRTFYFGWVPHERINDQIELLADMMRPALPPDEFDTEKKVILEEIAMSKDSIDHVAFDFLLERVYEGHSLAWPILGYTETVGALTRDQMNAYMNEHYAPDRMVLVVAGNVDPPRIIDLAERLCGSWKRSGGMHARVAPTTRTGSATQVVDRFQQQLVALTFAAPCATDPLHESAEAAMSILGGSNSRFYWNIVQAGISPHANSFRFDMGDCGLTILSGQAEPDRIEPLLEAMKREAAAISRDKVSADEVERVKNKRRTSLAVEAESPYHRLTQIMDDVDYRGAPRTVDERLAAVDAVTRDSIATFFEKYPIDREGYLISVGPRDWPA
ncbi:MAG: insulinase family protein [Phycisphaerales bacterium]|nr:insulinase family protein [Phycisphaerales bacterium]